MYCYRRRTDWNRALFGVVREPVVGPITDPLDNRKRALLLREEALVTLSPRVRAIADSVGASHRDRYDYVLELMDYDKSVPGWGMGDTERACDVRKGNCTDFHSLFMSLSRARAVPALFEMGYPTKPEGESGRSGGYHCWAGCVDRRAAASIEPVPDERIPGGSEPGRVLIGARGREGSSEGNREPL